MQQQVSDDATAWSRGRLDGNASGAKLLFGQMYEDPQIEAEVFAGKKHIFCIASAGCTAISLAAAGHEVTAVDINPAQIAYVQDRLAGGNLRKGAADRLLSRSRSFLWLLGWRRSLLQAFLQMNDPLEQLAFWKSRLDTSRWKMASNVLLHPLILRAAYASPFLRSLPPQFGKRIRDRMERNWRTHANHSNPYAHRLLLGTDLEGEITKNSSEATLRLSCGDAATFLESCEPGRFEGFSLSNILDGASPEYRDRLMRSIVRAGTEDSVMIVRSFSEPAPSDNQQASWAMRDRSMLWGAIAVTKTRLA